MQVFEFHFNPKVKESVVIDSFIYEPENVSEKRLGNLYMAGELQNALPQDNKFLDNLAQVIKSEYYYDFQKSPESALRQALKKANEFLNKIAKNGKVNWLGNLNFAIVSVSPRHFLTSVEKIIPEAQREKWLMVNFAQVGEIKVLLLREEEILDISQDSEFRETNYNPPTTSRSTGPFYSLKIFENVVSGKLMPNDKIMILTKDIFDYFKNKDLLRDFINITSEKSLNELLKPRRKELSEISGVSLFIILNEFYDKKGKSRFKFANFSLNKFLPKIPHFAGLKLIPRLTKPSGTLSQQLPKIQPFLKKKARLILLLILILAGAFFVFKGEREKEFKIANQILEEVKSEKIQAENFLIFGDEAQSNLLLQSAWSKISPLTEPGSEVSLLGGKSNIHLQSEAKALKESIEKTLTSLNHLERISEPELVLEIPSQKIKIRPNNILIFDDSLYFFNPFSANIYKFNLLLKEGKVLNANRNIKLGISFFESILFFSNPNFLIQYFPKRVDNQFEEFILESEIPSEFNFQDLASYKSNLYFLDPRAGKIIKYFLSQNEILIGENWLNPKTKKTPLKGRSIVIDGNIWILDENSKIDRYYQGIFRESLNFNIFPFLKNPTKIFTTSDHPYLYLLEPAENRIIILTKHGEVVKQYQSNKFDNLLDFAVSKDNKTIYLLNGLKVYQISS